MNEHVEFFDPPAPPKTGGGRKPTARKQSTPKGAVRGAHTPSSAGSASERRAAPAEDGSGRVRAGSRSQISTDKPKKPKREEQRRSANVDPNRIDFQEEAAKGTGVPFATDSRDRLSLKLATYGQQVAGAPVGPRKLTTIPGVNALSFAMRYMEGGRDRFVEFVQMAHLNDMPNATNWLSVYAKLLPTERKIVSFDDVCAAAGVQPKNLMAEVVSSAMEIGQDVGNLIAASTHPAVVAQLAKSAQRIDGKHAEVSHKDRIAFLQSSASRFLPVSKSGSTVNVNTSASAAAAAAAAASEEPSVPSFAQDMERLAPVRQQVQRELGDPPTPAFLEGEVAE